MPGPLFAVRQSAGRLTMTWGAAFALLAWVVLALLVPTHFVFQTIAVKVHWLSATLWAGTAASAAILLAFGSPRLRVLKSDVRWPLGAAAAGAALLVIAPAVVLAHRFSDAPAGSVVAFWSTTFLGVLLLAAGVWRSPSGRLVAPGLSAIALVGAVGVLGNWERPSSFNLFVRYSTEQVAIVVATALCVLAAVVLTRLARTTMGTDAYGWAATGGLVASGLLGAWGVIDGADLVLPAALWPYPASAALLMLVLLLVLRRSGPISAGAAFVPAPALLSAIIFIEARLGMRGPQPMLAEQVLWGSAVLAVVALVMLLLKGSLGNTVRVGRDSAPSARSAFPLPWKTAGGILAAVSVGAAAWALFTDAIAAEVRADLATQGAFSAEFVFAGFQTAGGWMAAALALLAVGLFAFARAGELTRVRAGAISVVTIIAGLSWHALRYTPIHTWTSFVPVEIQQDFGSPYARITFSAVPVEAQGLAVAAAVASVGVLALGAFAAHVRGRFQPEEG